MNEDLLLLKRLEALRAQHKDVDDKIDSGGLDEFTRSRMQKIRLNLRDEIFRLEKLVYPDIIA